MDNILIVVQNLEAAQSFFAELGMELEGRTTVEGPWADRVVGLNGVRDIVMMRAPDGHSRVELSKSTRRPRCGPNRPSRPPTPWACAASCSPFPTSTNS